MMRGRDRAIQASDSVVASQDFGLGHMYRYARTLRIVEGSGEVHSYQFGRLEIARYPAGALP